VRSHCKDESGASLMMVIVFVMIFAVIVGAILDFASAGFKTTEDIVDVRNDQQALDAAMDGAINALRGSSTVGFSGVDCPQPFQYESIDGDDPDVEVTCEGVGGTTGTVTDNVPKYAILTLGTDASEGFTKTGNKQLTIDGGIFSNSKINIDQSDIRVLGDAYALGGCPPETGGEPTALFATGQRDCHLPAAQQEPDPNYEPAVSNISALAAVDPSATCVTTSNNSYVVTFSPGLYTKKPKNHVPSNCRGSVWWFSPGVYYFDFPDGDGLWDLHDDRVSIVGGTPGGGWSGSSLSSAVTFPGACDPGDESAPQPGVQFIFGGESRLSQHVASEAIELCPYAPGAGQRIAFYGLKSGTRTTTSDALRQADATTATNFLSPDDAKASGGGSATAALTGAANKSASLTLSSYGDCTSGTCTSPIVPAGATVTAASLEITHKESGTNPEKAGLTWTWKPKTGADVTCSATTSTSVHTDTCNILPTIQSSTFPHDALSGFKSTQLAVDASSLTVTPGDDCLKPNGQPKNNCTPTLPTVETATVEVDAIVMKISYTAPGFEAHRCPSSESNCAILETKTNPTAYFYGTFYAPSARVSVWVQNKGTTVFSRGIIARTIDGDVSASSKQDDSPFQLPGLVFTRTTLFEATIDGTPRLRAKVAYNDSKNGISLPGYQVKVLNWIVL
jgi:hypothetical protein